MAVQILHDKEGASAVLWCTTSNWAFGPVFEGGDAFDKADSFEKWFRSGRALERAVQLKVRTLLGDGHDPRHFSDSDLSRLYLEWMDVALDEDGELREAAMRW